MNDYKGRPNFYELGRYSFYKEYIRFYNPKLYFYFIMYIITKTLKRKVSGNGFF